MTWLEQLSDNQAHPLVLAVLICLGTLLSEDLACITAGILAAKGWLPFPLAVGASSLGILSGDLGLYCLGWLSKRWKNRWRWLDRLVSDARLQRGRRLFDRFGTKWIFLSRFLPGSRLPSYLAAGAVGWPFPRFAIALAIAVLMWTPILVGFAFYSGQHALQFIERYQRWAWPVLLAVGALLFLLLKVVIPLFSWRGRRLLAGHWRRLTHWEYWPALVVYPPAVLPLLRRPLRGKGVLDLLACNPAIPLSGFAMESKGDILETLAPPTPSRVRIARYERFAPAQGIAERLALIHLFAAKNQWPVVLKPDIGERGKGVAIIRNAQEAEDWLIEKGAAPAMVQEYIAGEEYGIHWARQPQNSTGVITSIARKLPQSLRGNGRDSLERLLLSDQRAAAMARHFLAQFADRLHEIPAKDEKVILTELGTHCLGAIFQDARDLLTPELSDTLNHLGLATQGIHFGRYDLRVPDEASLRRGEGLVILEFNGVTGEPAHIYQPGYPLWRGLRDLGAHYQLASEIGRSHLQLGKQQPTRWRALLAVIRKHRAQ